jgi:3D (Asp-Asp-Asp) domain-containing protein
MEFGTKERMQPTSRHAVLTGNQRVVKEMVVESTAYTHTGNTTFTGIWPYEGVVAVDPRVIPLGTKMYVEGYGYATAADTGGLIKGNIIDVFMDTHEKAVNWGRRQVKIYILE